MQKIKYAKKKNSDGALHCLVFQRLLDKDTDMTNKLKAWIYNICNS